MIAQRQIPDDFAEFAAIETNAQLRKRYGVGAGALTRWRTTTGIYGPGRTKVPAVARIPEWFEEAARTRTNRELEERAGVSNRTVRHWRSLLSIRAKTDGREPHNKIHAPPEFASLVGTMTRNGLRLHFNKSLNTIDRWCREAGVRPKAAPPRGVDRSARQMTAQAAVIRRDFTPAGRAADYLRRYGPVVRCDPRGQYDPNGEHWRRGSAVLAPQEVIERAERLGWAA